MKNIGFITGGAQGIGKMIATAYAQLGAEMATVDMNLEKAQETAKQLTSETGK